MHENHLFAFLPLLSLLGAGDRRLLRVYAVASLTLLLNMALHDPVIAASLDARASGPHLSLPQELRADARTSAYLMDHGYERLVEGWQREVSLIRLVLTLLNSQLNLILFAWWFACFHFRVRVPPMRTLVLLVAMFVPLTAVPFLQRAFRYPEERFVFAHFKDAKVVAGAPELVQLSTFNVSGDVRPVLFAHPPSEIEYTLRMPYRASLSFGLALDPAAWSQDGDGVGFEIQVRDGAVAETVFSRYIDPKRDPRDRRWHDEVVGLERYGGRDVRLRFLTRPQGDSRFDWAGWGDPVVRTR